MFLPQQYVALSDQWVLHANKNANILYKLSLSDSKYFTLNGLGGISLSLLDGSATFAQTAEQISELFSFPSLENCEDYLRSLFKKLNNSEKVILFSDYPISTTNRYHSQDYIVRKENYEIPRRLNSPIRLLIYPTGKCTTNCIYCYADLENLRKFPDLDLNQWRKIFDDAKSLNIRSIDVTGGDLFARRDAADFVCEMMTYGFLFFLSTKSYISASDARKIADAGFKTPVCGVQRDIQLSIDSVEEQITQRLMNVEGYVQRIEETAVNLIKAGIIPKIKCVGSTINYKTLDQLVLRFKELGVVDFNIVKYDASFYRHREEYLLTGDQEDYVREKMNRVAEDNRDILITGNLTTNLNFFAPEEVTVIHDDPVLIPDPGAPVGARKRLLEKTGCSAGRTTLGILPNGKACLCEQMHATEPFIFGDLTQQSILEIWNSPSVNQICFPEREQFGNSPCAACPDFDLCVLVKGHCFRDNYFGRNPDAEKGNLFRQPSSCYLLEKV